MKEISKLASTPNRDKASPAESVFWESSTEFRSGVAKLNLVDLESIKLSVDFQKSTTRMFINIKVEI